MLPQPTDSKFPEALKAAREAKGLSYTELAERIGIHPVMPSRYENTQHSNHCRPRMKVWHKLNLELFGQTVAEKVGERKGKALLRDASVEQIIKELKDRGAITVNVSF